MVLAASDDITVDAIRFIVFDEIAGYYEAN